MASPGLRYGIPWHVLVGAKTHETVPVLSRRAVRALLAESLMRICETGANLVLCQAGVVATDLGLAPSLREPSRTNSTAKRVPRTMGFPASTPGSTSMCSCQVMSAVQHALLIEFRISPLIIPVDSLEVRFRR
jgi:hypothetical protein